MYSLKEETKVKEATRQLVTGTYTGELDDKKHKEMLRDHLIQNYYFN